MDQAELPSVMDRWVSAGGVRLLCMPRFLSAGQVQESMWQWEPESREVGQNEIVFQEAGKGRCSTEKKSFCLAVPKLLKLI